MNPILATVLLTLSPPDVEAPAPTNTSTQGLALVTSGAVSLGAYQAGFLYFTTSQIKRSGLPPPILATGASAGAANSLIAAVEGCLPVQNDPTRSLGWQVWIPIGLEQLFVEDEVHPTGIFSSQAMMMAFRQVSSVLQSGLPEECDFVLGVTTTRFEPLPVELTPGLAVPRQEEKLAVRIQGRGPGRPARLSNYVDPYRDVPQPLLRLGTGITPEDYETLSTALFASASFPVAFPPTAVPHCLTAPPGRDRFIPRLKLGCAGPVRHDLFVDGGIFDNSPLRLAYELAQLGLRSDPVGRPVWRDLERSAQLDERPPFERLFYGYVDPWTRAYPPAPEGLRTEAEALDTVGYGLGLFGRLVTSARRKELYTLAESRDRLKGQFLLSRAHYPAASDLFYAFFGFFERDLRVFDFYLGMYDAYLGTRSTEMGVAAGPWATAEPPPTWRPFTCLLSWLEPGHEVLRGTCSGPELRNFRILLQVSLERLYERCRDLNDTARAEYADHPHCSAARGVAPPVVEARVPLTGSVAGTFGVLDRLAELQFEFRDLGLSRDQSHQIRTELRRRFVTMFERMEEAQPEGTLPLVGLGGRLLSNTLRYESPIWMVPILIGSGSVETGLLLSPFEGARDVLRLSASVQLRDWTPLLLPDPDHPLLAGTLGVELLAPPLTTGVLQPTWGLRGGYQFGSFDRFSTQTCRASPELADSRSCSQTLLQTYLGLGLMDLVRLQLVLDIYPESGFEDGLRQRNFGLEFQGGVTLF